MISLDAGHSGTENLYNCIGAACGRSPESEAVGMERVTELLSSLSATQRKIMEMKINGYGNKEIYSALEIKRSTFYAEIQRIKNVLAEMAG